MQASPFSIGETVQRFPTQFLYTTVSIQAYILPTQFLLQHQGIKQKIGLDDKYKWERTEMKTLQKKSGIDSLPFFPFICMP